MNADVIRAQMNVPCFVYNVKRADRLADGTGRNALVSRLLSCLRSGFSYYRIFDVRDCFGSVNPKAITKLPLPRRIYENTLKLNNLSFRHDLVRERKHIADPSVWRDINDAGGDSGPEGLLAGSPCSNVALAFLLQDLPQPSPEDGCILLYGDDLIILSRTPAIAERVDEAVTQFFEQPNLGPLHLHRKATGLFGSFEYLGYEFTFSEIRGDWFVGLSARNWDKLCRLRDNAKSSDWKMGQVSSEFVVGQKIRQSLAGHEMLTDAEAIFDAIWTGGLDIVELSRWANNRNTAALATQQFL
ncbi:hypothetical protein ACOTTU_10100 [Roseobacter sp. EG26]|uniref:hypothetical protein n=1 Tax=Roseobacter sp. EG26 TaxID=3412477 RepID=UPI003CE55532